MGKRRWTNMQVHEVQILAMREAGYSRKQIAEALGVEMIQIKWWIDRYNKKVKVESLCGEKENRPKGRPRKDGQAPRQDIQKEVERLRMENKLLRDFLRSTERK